MQSVTVTLKCCNKAQTLNFTQNLSPLILTFTVLLSGQNLCCYWMKQSA